MPEEKNIEVQVCYSSGDAVSLLDVLVSCGATVRDAVNASRILEMYPELNLDTLKIGIYGKLKDASAVLHAGDRVEIYRSLLADPMEARRRRAQKQQKTAV